MTVHSGKNANVNGVPTMRQWSIEERVTPARATASSTKQGVQRKKGVRAWSGSINCYGATPIVLPGQSLSFIGYGAPTDDVSGNGHRYSGTAYCNSVSVNWNWKSAEIISHTINFVGHLALTKALGADPGDTTVPDTPPVVGTKLEYKKVGGAFVELANLTSASLTLTRQIQSYVNSSTLVTGVCWTGQRVGAPMDWTLALQQEDDERVDAAMFDIGDDLELKLYADATAYWSLVWGYVEGFTGITVDRESGAILSRTINLGMDCYYGNNDGEVITPSAVTWFPPA